MEGIVVIRLWCASEPKKFPYFTSIFIVALRRLPRKTRGISPSPMQVAQSYPEGRIVNDFDLWAVRDSRPI